MQAMNRKRGMMHRPARGGFNDSGSFFATHNGLAANALAAKCRTALPFSKNGPAALEVGPFWRFCKLPTYHHPEVL